ncbi:membrane transport protein [Halarchaeum acidiphilum MH1-52-1]|uniref:Membrane transport protein n=1 Tax=Halarchaeum acidiphilum MH1-52-1 TaxID=1261545 RepID=U3A4Y7_9EURY|nr:membrane transport protein [Halarchaeum acidiphilum MH1-52-1]
MTSTRILALLATTAVFTVLFGIQERRASEPVFPVRLLRDRTVAGVDALSFCVGVGMLGGTTYLPVFLQTVLGQSATNSGLLLLPLVGGLMLTNFATGQLMTRIGRYKPFTVAGTGVAAVGYYLFSTMGVGTTHLESAAFMFVAGLGLGFVMPTLTVAVQNVVERSDLGVATTSVTFSRSLGSAIGVSVFGAVLTSRLAARLAASDLSPAATRELADAGSNLSPQVLADLPPDAVPVVRTALAHSIDLLFLTGALIIAIGFLVALSLPSVELGEDANVQIDEDANVQTDEDANVQTDEDANVQIDEDTNVQIDEDTNVQTDEDNRESP